MNVTAFKEHLKKVVFSKEVGCRPVTLLKMNLSSQYSLRIPTRSTERLHIRRGFNGIHVSVEHLLMVIPIINKGEFRGQCTI